MIPPIMPIQPVKNPPRRKQQAFMRIDRKIHTIVCDTGERIVLPSSEAWALLDEIKTGRIYDECC